MSRQDANAAFALSSFLYGSNAPYIEDMYARFEAEPGLGGRRVAGILQKPEGPARRREAGRRRSVLGEAELAGHAARRSRLRARWQLGAGREGGRRQARREGAGEGRRTLGGRRAAGDARFDPRADADPRLSHARTFPRQSRSARASSRRRTTRNSIRARMASPTPISTARSSSITCSGLDFATSARDRRDLPAHLLPDARRRVHAHLQSAAEGLDSGAHRRSRQGDQLHAGRQARDPAEAGRGGRLREILRREIHRHQALRARRRRVADSGAGADHQARRQSRREGDRHRHAASRPPQRAHAGDGQAAPRPVPRIQGWLVDAGRDRRLRRREVSSRRIVGPRLRRQQRPSVADGKSVASRDRRSGGARQGARQAGSASRSAGHAHFGDAAAAAWRRGVRGPGRRGRMFRTVGPEGLSHRRLGALHRQQPDRLHHLSALFALVALSVGCGEDDRRADLPCERRRSGSGGVRGQGRDRIPAEIPQAGRHRHVLLSPLRSQRRRRARLHPAADVQEDPLASDDAGDLFAEADRREGDDRRRGRQGEGRLARAARSRVRGRHRLQAEQGRLARRPLDRA